MKGLQLYRTPWVTLQNNMLNKGSHTKIYILYYSIYVKILKLAKLIFVVRGENSG